MRIDYKRSLATLAATGLILALSACGSSDDSSDAGSPPASDSGSTATVADGAGGTDGTFDVAVVMPSAANDLAFSQSMADALNTLKDDGVIDSIAMSENMFVTEDAAAAIRDYATKGFDLVIAHGSQYGASLQEIAPDFPDTAFAWGTAADTFGLDNVSGYEAAADEGAYVLGRMAALLSESNVLGVIGPIEVGDGKLYSDGFVNGAKSAVADIDVEVNWTESFSDVALAAEAATAFVSAGADGLSGSSQMTVGAIGVAKDKGVRWFGTDVNQTQLAPDVIVANQVYKWEVVLKPMIESIKGGQLGGETYRADLADGGEVIEFNDGYDLPADVRADADATIAGIKDGSISTGAAG